MLLLVLMGGSAVLPLHDVLPAPPPLLPLAVLATAAGATLAWLRLRRLWSLAFAAIAGGALTTWMTASRLSPESALLEQLLLLRAELLADPGELLSMEQQAGRAATSLAVLALAWAMPLIAARGFVLRRRASDAWGPLGALLLGGLLLSEPAHLWPLVVFTSSALLLALVAAAAARERRWQRRALTRADEVPRAIARHGWAATFATVALAWALTSVAVGAPLDSAWRQLGEWWSTARAPALSIGWQAGGFEPSFQISGRFDASGREVVRLSGLSGPAYLLGSTHDTYTGSGWAQQLAPARQVAPEAPLFIGSQPEAVPAGAPGSETTVRVRLERSLNVLLAPGRPVRFSVEAVVSESAHGPFLALVGTERMESGDAYAVTAILGHATAEEMDAAGEAYPPELAPYLSLEGVSGRTRDEAVRIAAGQATPYRRALALVDYLRDGRLGYSTRAPRPDPGAGQDLVDFFLFDDAGGRGTCEYFASAMVVMARSAGIPARLVRGYAGGDRLGGGEYLVRERNAHAWAELYFPGHGWQVFEATPRAGLPRIRMAVPVESAMHSPTPSASPTPRPPQGPAISVAPPSAGPGGEVQSAVLAVVVLVATVAALLAARHRRVRVLESMDGAAAARWWVSLTHGARRAGVMADPSLTAYEYAGEVERSLPEVGGEIRLIASAYVTQAYAGGRAAPRNGEELAAAWRRVTARLRRLRLRRMAVLWRRH